MVNVVEEYRLTKNDWLMTFRVIDGSVHVAETRNGGKTWGYQAMSKEDARKVWGFRTADDWKRTK